MKAARGGENELPRGVRRALRAFAAALRSHAGGLPARTRARLARWRLLLPLAKTLPERALRWREATLRWMRRQSGPRLRLGAVSVLLALGIGSAAIYGREIGLYYRAATASGSAVPLPSETRTAVREKAKQLASALDRRLDKRRRLARDTWTSARVLAALRHEDDASSRRVGPKVIERYFRSLAGPECACWRSFPDGRYPNHVGITSWVLGAMAEYGIPAQAAELRFLLSAQGGDGAWPQFAGANGERFASSYATAAAILALHAQSAVLSDSKLRRQLAEGVRRGADWLKKRAAQGGARWADYPAGPGNEFLGLSGFVLVALHRVGAAGLEELDRDWIRRLPGDAPVALAAEASAKTVRIGKRSYADRTRFYALPWLVLATASAYPNLSLAGRARAIEWLEGVLAPGASIHALTGREKNVALVAETLLALNGAAGRSNE